MADHGATSSSHFKYDVFLSFRGDTRFGFTDCLYHALINRRINAFRDVPNLRLGDEIGPTLLDAIQKSRMSIVVLCQNYASSKWCLDELEEIMKCSDDGRDRPVFPVFYQVDPADVRHQRNQYETAMINHEKRYGKDSDEVKAWKSALFAVCKLSGEHCTKGKYEGEIIDKIVVEVLKKIPPRPLYIKHSLGFDFQLEEVKSLLDIESHDILCMLGIYGDGETQKTAFVVELYNKIRHQFEAASFLANVSEESRESNGLEDLQKILLFEMGEEIKTDIGSTFKGSFEIKRRLGHKRVLLVLDNVDSVKQLDCLAGRGDWFGLGSRIIITTRNEDVLDKHVLDGVENKKYCIDEGGFKGNKRRRAMEEEDVVGFVNNFNIVINQLKEEDSRSNVVSIIGMGGLGKTTLARKIYHNNEVKRLFHYRAWSSVSKDYTAKEVLLNLLRCLMSFEYNNLSEEELKEVVRRCLKKKKYLVVLDDIWEPEVWDDIKGIFPDDNNGSKILITSRHQEVAYYTSPNPPHFLPFLDEEESWELFCKKVFWGEACPSDLEPLGRSIVESCGGLPLAIVTLAGLLAKKKRSKREWLRIKGYVRWHLAQEKTKVMDVLKLSYDRLPEILKPCFLYFGIYPEDYEIPARRLIQLWIAEEFIKPHEIGIPNAPKQEDIGEEYLDELVDRSLIQVASRKSDGGVKTCRIHDLLHDLCVSESKANNFLEVCTESNIQTLSNPHRLSLLCDANSYISSIGCNQSNSTHSLFFFAGGKYPLDNTLKNFQSVHVLHYGRQVYFRLVPNGLETMIHLRYLRIECNRKERVVPDCIWSLQNLETLDIWVPYILEISIGIWELKRLRHVHVTWGQMLPAEKLGSKSKTMWNLQTICNVLLDRQIPFRINNGNFPNLRKLGLWYRYDPNEDKSSLYELLQSLHRLSNLRTLKLECNGSKLSLDAIVFPSNLTKITFQSFCDLDSRSMSTLGGLPNLQSLKLSDGDIVDSLNCATGEFPQLQVFIMTGMCVGSWRLEKGAMPNLQHLVIDFCTDLNDLPDQLWSITTLQQVHVSNHTRELENNLKNVEVKNGCKLISTNAIRWEPLE